MMNEDEEFRPEMTRTRPKKARFERVKGNVIGKRVRENKESEGIFGNRGKAKRREVKPDDAWVPKLSYNFQNGKRS